MYTIEGHVMNDLLNLANHEDLAGHFCLLASIPQALFVLSHFACCIIVNTVAAGRLFLDSEPEGHSPATRKGLALTRFSGNAMMSAPDGEESRLFLSSSPSG